MPGNLRSSRNGQLARLSVCLNKQSAPIFDRGAVGERRGVLQICRHFHGTAGECPVPGQQVTDSGQQSTIPIGVLKRHILLVPRRPTPIGNSAIRDDTFQVVTPLSVLHAERDEEILPGEFRQRQLADPLHDDGQ